MLSSPLFISVVNCYVVRMTRNQTGLIYAVCLIVFGVAMGCIHFLITGINDDFGTGIVVGMLVGMGLIGLASRNVRETP